MRGIFLRPAYPPTGHLFHPRGGLALVERIWTPNASGYDPYVYRVSSFEPGEDYLNRRQRSSHSAGISSDFTPLGSIRKLEDLARLDLYTGKTH